MGNERLGNMKEGTAKEIIENVAEYLETHESISGLIFGKLAWDWDKKPKRDYTWLSSPFTKALLEVLEEYFKRNYGSTLTKEAFYERVKQVKHYTAYEIFSKWGS